MSTKSLARANSKKNIQLEDLEAVPQCLSYKYDNIFLVRAHHDLFFVLFVNR